MSLRTAFSQPMFQEVFLTLLLSVYAIHKGNRFAKYFLPCYLLFLPNISLFQTRSNRVLRNKEPARCITWEEVTKPCGGPTNEKYVVFGGSGFIGERVIHALLLRGETHVECFDLIIEDHMVQRYGDRVKFTVGDIRNRAQVAAAVRNADAVFLIAAVIRFYERLDRHYHRSADVNVEGTRNVLECCAEAGVKRLVATSSSGATMRYPFPEYYDESAPLATEDAIYNYAKSKAFAEKLVISSNGSSKQQMATGCIRPTSFVFGFRDKNLFDRFLKMGAMVSLTDEPQEWVHVDSCVLAHLLLEKRLRNGAQDEAAGQSFNIAGPSATSWADVLRLMNESCELIKYDRKMPLVQVPLRLFWVIGLIGECLTFLYPGDWVRLVGNDAGILGFGMLINSTAQPPAHPDRNGKAERILAFRSQMSIRDSICLTMLEYKHGNILMEKDLATV